MNSTVEKLIENGIEFEDTREYYKAIDCYNKAIKLQPNNLDAWIKIGELYGFMNEIERAMYIFAKVLDIDPKNKVALEYRRLFGEKC